MIALLKLQAKSWVSNFGSWLGFIMSILFLFVIGSLNAASISNAYNNGSVDADAVSRVYLTVLGSIIILNSMNAAIQTFGFSFFQMRESVLLKRIGATQISKFEAIFSFMLWGFITMWFQIIWTIFWVFIMTVFGHEGGLFFITNHMLSQINWLGAFVSIMLNAIAFYAISLFFVSIAKNSEIYNIFATFYFFFVAFLGGGFSPDAAAGREWMTVIGQLTPFGWTSHMMIQSVNGAQVFHLGGYAGVTSSRAISDIILPLIYGGLAMAASVKFFRWDK